MILDKIRERTKGNVTYSPLPIFFFGLPNLPLCFVIRLKHIMWLLKGNVFSPTVHSFFKKFLSAHHALSSVLRPGSETGEDTVIVPDGSLTVVK